MRASRFNANLLPFIAILSLCLLAFTPARADDSIPSPPKGNIFERFIRYLDSTNRPTPARGADFSLIGGPFYSSDTKFGIGLVAALLYYNSPADSGRVEPSNVSLKGQLSTTLFYKFSLDGCNFFPGDTYRLLYTAEFQMLPTYNWGIGWARATDDAYKSRYRDLDFHLLADFRRRLVGPLFAGVQAEFYYSSIHKIERPEVWDSYPLKATTVGLGIIASYDTRDFTTAPEHGYNLTLRQLFCPRFLGNTTHGYSSTEVEAAGYWPGWRGATIAARARGVFTWGNTPWMRMPTIGGSSYMRGYYEGQYRAKRVIDATLELRQHVWKRSGIVAWIGAAEMWSTTAELKAFHVLPNAGVGYRFEFKKHMNVRVDVGFGCHTWGVEFNMNEAF